MEQLNPIIVEVIKGGAIIAAAFITARSAIYLRKYNERKKKRKKYGYIESRIQLDGEIHGMLGALRERTNADRAYIFQFHPEEKPLQFSCSYEEVRAGVSSVVDERQHLLLSQHTNFVSKLTDQEGSCCSANMFTTERFGKLLLLHGVKVMCMMPIHNDYSNLIGFVALDYCNSSTLDVDVKSALRDFSYNVSVKLRDYEG